VSSVETLSPEANLSSSHTTKTTSFRRCVIAEAGVPRDFLLKTGLKSNFEHGSPQRSALLFSRPDRLISSPRFRAVGSHRQECAGIVLVYTMHYTRYALTMHCTVLAMDCTVPTIHCATYQTLCCHTLCCHTHTVLPHTVLPYTVMPYTVLPYTVYQYTVLPYTVLPYTVYQYTVLPYTVLPYTVYQYTDT
jgi:hypothetical protein